MSDIIPGARLSDEMKRIGTISFWPAVSAVAGTVLYTITFLVASRSGNHPGGMIPQVIAQLGHALGPYAGFVALVTLVSELFTFIVLAIAAARWRFRIIHSPYLMTSALCAALVGVVILFLIVTATTLAISPG